MRARLIRLAVSLYPRRVRDRYGDELTDLLEQSTTPGRDLADVIWCALTDRGGAADPKEVPIMSRIRAAALTVAKLLCAPIVCALVLVVLMAALGAALNVGFQSGLLTFENGTERLVQNAYAAMVLPAGLIIWWLGRRLGRGPAPTRSGVVVPVGLALGFAAFALIPEVGQALGEDPPSSVLAAACWCAGLIVLLRIRTALVAAGRGALAAVTATLGSLVVLQLSCIGYVLTALPPERAPRQYAMLWYPSVMSGIDPGLVDDGYLQLADAMKLGPAVLTLSTVLALAVVTVTAKRPQPVLQSA